MGHKNAGDRAQYDEDIILREIVEILNKAQVIVPQWIVEFGAWDGEFLSNAHYWLKDEGWSGVLIEGNQETAQICSRYWSSSPGVHCFHGMVGWEPNDDLCFWLSKTPIPKTFGILSIDVDGNDYHIWKALAGYRPKIVVIEFNFTIPPDVHFVQKRSASVNQGNSLKAIVELANELNYSLVSVNQCNAFFVESEDLIHFGLEDNSLEVLWTKRPKFPTAFVLFDGTVQLSSAIVNHWAEGTIWPNEVQFFPRAARGFKPKKGAKLLRSIWLNGRKLKRSLRKLGKSLLPS